MSAIATILSPSGSVHYLKEQQHPVWTTLQQPHRFRVFPLLLRVGTALFKAQILYICKDLTNKM